MDKKEQTLEACLLELRRLTSTDFAALALLDEAKRVVRWTCASGSRNNRYKRIVLRIGKGIPGKVMRSGRPLLIDSFRQQAGDDPSDYPILLAEGLQSIAAYPLSIHERVVGVLVVGTRFDHRFPFETLEMLENAAEQFGSMISRDQGNSPQESGNHPIPPPKVRRYDESRHEFTC